jgi:hypothetical protein
MAVFVKNRHLMKFPTTKADRPNSFPEIWGLNHNHVYC